MARTTMVLQIVLPRVYLMSVYLNVPDMCMRMRMPPLIVLLDMISRNRSFVDPTGLSVQATDNNDEWAVASLSAALAGRGARKKAGTVS
jgi:hypothetical protein